MDKNIKIAKELVRIAKKIINSSKEIVYYSGNDHEVGEERHVMVFHWQE